MTEEEEIIEEVKSGNQECFALLVDKYKNKVYSMAYQYTHNDMKAQDLAQDIFIKIYKNIGKFQYKSKFSTWVYKISINECIDWNRKNKKNKEVFIEDYYINKLDLNIKDNKVSAEENIILSEEKELLVNMIKLLKDKYKSVIILHHFYDLSINDISEILRIPVKTVYTRIRRGREEIGKSLDKYQFGDDGR